MDLTQTYGTPLYRYQLADLRVAADALRQALPQPARLYYSLKANPHPVLVEELVRAGYGSEVSSTQELSVALRAGQSPAACLMTGPGKSPAEIQDALDRGVRTFSVESETDFRRLAAAAADLREPVATLLRLNQLGGAAGSGGLRMSGVASQFGMAPETAVRLLAEASPAGPLQLAGVHLFPATNVADPDDLLAEFTTSVATTASLLRQAGIEGTLVDLGGGFAAPFARPGTRPQYGLLRDRLCAVLDEHLPGWRQGRPQIAFESGRYLVGGCGTLLTTVLDVKISGATTYVVVDAGVNALGGMSGLGRILAPDVQLVDEPPAARDARRVSLVGPLCTPLDVLSRSLAGRVPAIGDVLEIPNVGAYGFSASLLAFLSRPVPAEVVVEADGSVRHARRIVLTDSPP